MATKTKFERDKYRANAMEMVRRASAGLQGDAKHKDAAQQLANAMTKLAADNKQYERGIVRATNQAEAVASDASGKNVLAAFIAIPIFAAEKFFYGADKTKAAEMIAHWEETGAEQVGTSTDLHPVPWEHLEGANDPRTYFNFMPKALVHTGGWLLASGIFALLGGKNNRANVGTRAGLGLAGLTFVEWVGSWAEGLGAERTMRKMLGGQQRAA